MTVKTDLPPIPPALAEVALIDGPTCAATGDMSLSWWHEEVRAGRAPAPVIRLPRCSRWSLAAVKVYWSERARTAAADSEASDGVTLKAKRASNAAKVKRTSSINARQ
jgi:hypothetical protein